MKRQEETGGDIGPKLEAIKYFLIGTVLITGLALLNFFLELKKKKEEKIQIP